MKQKKSPAFDKALAYLKKNIDDGIWKDGDRLPTHEHLAAQSDVAPLTMLKAIKELQQKGVLYSKRKMGIILGQPGTKTDMPSVNNAKWSKIAALLKKEMLEGSFHNEEYLPSIKELAALYDTGYSTIKKALTLLEKDRHIVPSKKKYRITRFKASSTYSKIQLIMTEQRMAGAMFGYEKIWIETMSRSLEKECSRRNVLLEKEALDHCIRKGTITNVPLGFVVWFSIDILNDYSSKEIISFFTLLAQSGKIVTIFNITGVSESEFFDRYCKTLVGNSRIYFADFLRDREAGREVGRFFASRENKKICYFGLRRDHLYAVERYMGLVEALASNGNQHKIPDFFVSDTIHGDLFQWPDLSMGLPDNQQLERKNKIYQGFIDSISHEMKQDKFHEDQLLNFCLELYHGLLMRRYFEPLFEQALAHKYNLWICMDDYVANYAALEYLKSKNLRVPRDVGIVGFGDQTESSFNGISSFHFNFEGMALKMINSIVYTDTNEKRPLVRAPNMFQVNGWVVDRGSV